MSRLYRPRPHRRQRVKRFVWTVGIAAVIYQKDGSLVAGTTLSGADTFTASEAGSFIAQVLLTGGDAFTAAEAGSLVADTEVSGTRSRDRNRDGSLVTSARLSGADAFTASETGALIASALESGLRVAIYNREGALVAAAFLSGESFVSSATLTLDPIHTGHVVFGTTGGFHIVISGDIEGAGPTNIHDPHHGITEKVEEGVAS